MTTEFNLSEKIIPEQRDPVPILYVDDVKEAVRLLKEKIINAEQSGYINDEQIDLREEIDKIFGDKLTQ